jgi:hypothetical protein
LCHTAAQFLPQRVPRDRHFAEGSFSNQSEPHSRVPWPGGASPVATLSTRRARLMSSEMFVPAKSMPATFIPVPVVSVAVLAPQSTECSVDARECFYRSNHFREVTIRLWRQEGQGRPDLAPPGLAGRTFFFGSKNLPDLSGSTPPLTGYLRSVKPGLRPPSPLPRS